MSVRDLTEVHSPDSIAEGDVAIVGVPWDEMSSYLNGPSAAPDLIREALHCGSANMSSERGVDIAKDGRVVDVGNLSLPEVGNPLSVIEAIEGGIGALLGRGAKVLSLGGDHAVTFPILRAYAKKHSGLNILHFDAHPDLYDEYEGNRYAHGCPFARIMEEGLAKRLVQVGIRTMNDHQAQQAKRFGVEVIDMLSFDPAMTLEFDGPLYISMDIDGLDPAFAPGVSHFEPGGLSVREVINLVDRISAPIVGADIVEYNPTRDHHDMTAMVAAKLLKEFVGAMLSR